jgi:hypothetical protein
MTYQEMSPAEKARFDAFHDPEFMNWGQEDWKAKEEWAGMIVPRQRVAPIRTLATPMEIQLELQGVPQTVARQLAHQAIEGLAAAS